MGYAGPLANSYQPLQQRVAENQFGAAAGCVDKRHGRGVLLTG
jgi:hypothetical protein